MTSPLERINALLVDEATDCLDDKARAELEELLFGHPDVDRYAFERAASAVFLAVGMPDGEELPPALRSRLAADAEKTLDSQN